MAGGGVREKPKLQRRGQHERRREQELHLHQLLQIDGLLRIRCGEAKSCTSGAMRFICRQVPTGSQFTNRRGAGQKENSGAGVKPCAGVFKLR
jgi:hypothetical protein